MRSLFDAFTTALNALAAACKEGLIAAAWLTNKQSTVHRHKLSQPDCLLLVLDYTCCITLLPLLLLLVTVSVSITDKCRIIIALALWFKLQTSNFKLFQAFSLVFIHSLNAGLAMPFRISAPKHSIVANADTIPLPLLLLITILYVVCSVCSVQWTSFSVFIDFSISVESCLNQTHSQLATATKLSFESVSQSPFHSSAA